MKEQRFVKDLTADELNELLNFILDKFNLEDNELSRNFYSAMVNYITTVRRSVETFERNVGEIVEVFSNFGYDNNEIMSMLTKEPSLLHANKNDILWRMLLLGKVIDTKTGKSVRENYLIQNPRILRISQDIMYARIKYLESTVGAAYLRKNTHLTARQITKITHNEFSKYYQVDKNELLNMYPFDNNAQLEVVSWEENKELLDNIYRKSI